MRELSAVASNRENVPVTEINSPDRPPANVGRFAYIDSLRAIAAILVLWTHVSESFLSVGPSTQQSRWVYEWAHGIDVGRIGVVAFFAISGFVVPFSIRIGHPYAVREFLLKRFLRLYPAYWLSMLLGLVAIFWIWGRQFAWSNVLVNLTILESVFNVPAVIGLYWTLAVEFVFYLCCVALVLTGSIANYRRIGVLVVALMAIHVGIIALRQFASFHVDYTKALWPMHIAIMLWGTVYRASIDGTRMDAIARTCLWGALCFMLVVYPVLFTRMFGFPLKFTLPYSLGILLFVLGTTVLRMTFKPLPWLGKISYSLYLFHPIVFVLLWWVLVRVPATSWLRTQHLGSYVVVVALATVLLAALVYRFVEAPSIALGQRLTRRWFREEPRSATAVQASSVAARTQATQP